MTVSGVREKCTVLASIAAMPLELSRFDGKAVAQSRLGFLDLAVGNQLRARLNERGIDRIANLRGMLDVRQSRRNHQQAGVLLVRKVTKQLIGNLILDDQFAIQS